jgi:malate dehydrogenase (oxaloacetate-decarboxylating)
MFVAAARALAELSPALSDPAGSLYPRLERVCDVSRRVALAVGAEAQRAGVARETTTDELERRVEEKMWTPRYARYKLKTE